MTEQHATLSLSTLSGVGRRPPAFRAARVSRWRGEASAVLHHSGHFPSARVLSKLPGTVALRTAKATPPGHKVGYYSNGSGHAEVVAVSALEQRLFIDVKNGIFSTNAEDHITRVLTGRLAQAELPTLRPLRVTG